MKIDGFRGLRNLELKQLGTFNLLIGENNTGKTSILEALAILSDPTNLEWWNEVARTRDYSWSPQSPIENLEWLFQHDLESSTQFSEINIQPIGDLCPLTSFRATGNLEIKAYEEKPEENEDEGRYRLARIGSASGDVAGISVELNISLRETASPLFVVEGEQFTKEFEVWENDFRSRSRKKIEPLFKHSFTPPYHHRATKFHTARMLRAVDEGLKNNILELLQLFDKNISDFKTKTSRYIRPTRSTWLKYGDSDFMPLQTFGDGVQAALNSSLNILFASDGLYLIDELDTALHTSVLPKVINWLIRAARQHNVQIFATTHSLEVVDALLEGGEEDKSDDIVVYRLGMKDGQSTAKRLDREMLWSLRGKMGLEVR